MKRRNFILGGLIAAPAIIAIDRLMPVKLWNPKPQFDPIILSLIRREWPKMIAYQICGVQPLTSYAGMFFELTPEYAETGKFSLNFMDQSDIRFPVT
jgi:hypothetical protein